MKISSGKWQYRAPLIGILEGAFLQETRKSHSLRIRYVTPENFWRMKVETHGHGQPMFMTLSEKKVLIAPIPNRSYILTLRYYPPLVQS